MGDIFRDIYCANSNLKRAEVVTLIPDKINFKTRNVLREKERHFIMAKRKQDNNNNYKCNVPHSRTPKYIEQIWQDDSETEQSTSWRFKCFSLSNW